MPKTSRKNPVPTICAYSKCRKVFPSYDIRRIYCSRLCSAQRICDQKRGRALETFWNYVQHCEHEWLCPYCCWPWTRGLEPTGYGFVTINNDKINTHRLVWELWNQRPFPEGLQAAHYCHNRACCNFIHIHPATPKGNIADSVRDRRMTHGEAHHSHKLTETDVLAIFALREQGWKMSVIARHYHVNPANIKALFDGRIWKHINPYAKRL